MTKDLFIKKKLARYLIIVRWLGAGSSCRKWALWCAGLLIKCIRLLLARTIWLGIRVVPIFGQRYIISFAVAIDWIGRKHARIIWGAFEQFLHSPCFFLSAPLPARVKYKSSQRCCYYKYNRRHTSDHCGWERIVPTIIWASGC